MGGFLKIVDPHGRRIPASMFMSAELPYEGAAFGRRMSSWGTAISGPNTALFSSLSSLRSRSRQLVRNDPLMHGGMNTLVSNLIGTGITPRWQIEDSDLKKELQLLWLDWTDEADADGVCDFYGLQALAAREMIDSGEIFIRFRPRYLEDGLSVPLQLQLIESDHLDETYNTVAPNGNEIRMGIEFNRIGQRAAYIFRGHPKEAFLISSSNPRNKNRVDLKNPTSPSAFQKASHHSLNPSRAVVGRSECSEKIGRK